VHKLPVIFVVENNGYAISVPEKEQYAVEKLADRGPAFGFNGVRVNGSDFSETYLAFKQAVTNARQGNGPTLIEMMVERLTSHSSDDDQRVYRSPEELATIKENDPVKKFQQQLIDEGYLNETDIDRIEKELETEINQATDDAEVMPDPDPAKITDQLYAE
ncbi:2-oxoisovalerate dehydrogenase, partial [Lacticaseibacillus rhamnosus]